MAAQETFDPKMLAPIEYRGPLGTVKTKLDGVHFSEFMKETAKVADKITVVRSMTHGEADHDRGTHNMFTGYRPSPAMQYPEHRQRRRARTRLAQRSCLRTSASRRCRTRSRAQVISARPLARSASAAIPPTQNFKVRDLTLPGGVDEKRFAQRREMRQAVDAHFSALEKSDALDGMDSFYQRAYSMVSSEKARAAFSINDEPDKLRDEYGRNTAGQRMLLARRLVEAGVRFVSLTYGGWDHHDNIKNAITGQMPKFDQAYRRA